MLQPMHARMSPSRPSSIFRGSHGSAMLGRAAPIRSHAPDSTISSHPVGRRQPGHAHDRLGRRLAHLAGPLELPALGEEARRAGVLRPLLDRADVDVPQVDEVVGEPHELEPLVQLDPGPADGRDRDPAGDRAVRADRLAHRGERLDPHPGPVLERAAVLVVALVVERREHLPEQVGVAAVDVDDVEAGVARADRGRHPVGHDPVDVPPLHPLRRDVREVARDLRGRRRREARLAVLAVRAGVRELDPRQRAVPVGLLGDERGGGRGRGRPTSAPR